MSMLKPLIKEKTRVHSSMLGQAPDNVDAITAEASTIHPDLINSEHLFYDLLFGDDADSLEAENSLEQEVIQRIGEQLLEPQTMTFESFAIPLAGAMTKIGNDAPLDQIELSLEQDLVLAANIVKLANTAAYNGSECEVTNLKMAIDFIGLTALKQIVTVASAVSVMKVCPIYYKVFGEKIWRHSVITAKLCKWAAIEQGADPYAAYFVGLIHDLGKVAIFKVLVDAMQSASPSLKPGSIHFRKMITSMSKQLTLSIVRYWKLPSAVIEPLAEHVNYKKLPTPLPLTKILVDSSLMSELALLLEAEKISELDVTMILMSHDINVEKLAQIKNVVHLR